MTRPIRSCKLTVPAFEKRMCSAVEHLVDTIATNAEGTADNPEYASLSGPAALRGIAAAIRNTITPSAIAEMVALLSSEAEHEAFVAAEKAIAKPAKKRGAK